MTFTYTISDGNGGEDTATASVSVLPQPDAPVLADAAFGFDNADDSGLNVFGTGTFALVEDGDGGIDTPDGTGFVRISVPDQIGTGPFTRFDGYPRYVRR